MDQDRIRVVQKLRLDLHDPLLAMGYSDPALNWPLETSLPSAADELRH